MGLFNKFFGGKKEESLEEFASRSNHPDQNNPESDYHKASCISGLIAQTISDKGLDGLDKLVIIATNDNMLIAGYNENNIPKFTKTYFCFKNYLMIQVLKNSIKSKDSDSIYMLIDIAGRDIWKELKK